MSVYFTTDFILGHINYWLFIFLMMTGLYIVIARGNFIKKIVHWFIDNRKIRLQKGQNIFRYYWYLWLLSPMILLVLILVLAFTTGVLEGLKELQ